MWSWKSWQKWKAPLGVEPLKASPALLLYSAGETVAPSPPSLWFAFYISSEYLGPLFHADRSHSSSVSQGVRNVLLLPFSVAPSPTLVSSLEGFSQSYLWSYLSQPSWA